MQVPNCSNYPSIFVDVGEDLITANDVATPLNPPFALVEEEEFEEALFDLNVSQWSREEESFTRVVRTQVDHSAW
jgi:hypothetical protein